MLTVYVHDYMGLYTNYKFELIITKIIISLLFTKVVYDLVAIKDF